MSDDLLREELRTKKRALQATRLQLARYGISAPVNLIMDEEDLAKEVRAIERELGAEQTPTIRERRAGPPVERYSPPVESAEQFRERVVGERLQARQRDIEHQLNLLKIHRRNLAVLREQARYFGGLAAAPLATQNGIMDAKSSISVQKRALRQLGIEPDDLPGDE